MLARRNLGVITSVALFIAMLLLPLTGISSYLSIQLIILAILATLFALPHGSTDFDVARVSGMVTNVYTAIRFIFGYLALVFLSVLGWWFAPTTFLVIFLVASVYHFSGDWKSIYNRATSIAVAAMVVFGGTLLHAETYQLVLSYLLITEEMSGMVIKAMQVLSLISFLVLALGLLSRGETLKQWHLIEIAALVSGVLLLEPLVFFTLYFCLLHSLNHTRVVIKQLKVSFSQLLLRGLPFWGGTLVLIAGYYYWFATGVLVEDLARWLFVGLFALTVPHMILVETKIHTDR